MRVALKGRFLAEWIVFFLPCLTTDGAVNARVAVANQQLRDLSLTSGFGLISNDNNRDLMGYPSISLSITVVLCKIFVNRIHSFIHSSEEISIR